MITDLSVTHEIWDNNDGISEEAPFTQKIVNRNEVLSINYSKILLLYNYTFLELGLQTSYCILYCFFFVYIYLIKTIKLMSYSLLIDLSCSNAAYAFIFSCQALSNVKPLF